MMAHLGSDLAGHYRSALRVTPTVIDQTHPVAWLLCDDWRHPDALWTLPPWFENNVTVIWLIRSDMVHLHAYQCHARADSHNRNAAAACTDTKCQPHAQG